VAIDPSLLNLEPVIDDGSAEVERLKQLTPAEYRKEHSITLRGAGSNEYVPMLDFESTPFHATLKKALKLEGFTSPTPIQSESWPIALQQRDIISIARTGSGKTCGFLLPAFHKLLLAKQNHAASTNSSSNSRAHQPETNSFGANRFQRNQGGRSKAYGRRPSALILAPTRELAVQIEAEAQKFSRISGLSTVSLYGGSSKGPQITKLKSGVDLVVATPGRCNDLAEMGVLDLSQVSYFVLDEGNNVRSHAYTLVYTYIYTHMHACTLIYT
jgi:ATP-dependent RNA helicase DDX5/DBP2